MKLKSDFFRILKEKGCWWVIKSLQSQNPDVGKQLEQFDRIAYDIEMSSLHNKRILDIKCRQIINHITPGRTDFIFSRIPQAMSLAEFSDLKPKAKDIVEIAYEENAFRASVLSEIKAFDELIKLGFKEIKFLEEEARRKTPDLEVLHNDQNILVEVKCINPERAEEQKMMVNLVEFVEIDPNWFEKVKKKIWNALTDAKAKFEAMNGYSENYKRWVYVSIIWWSANASAQHQDPEKLITYSLIRDFEVEFGIELRFFKTF